MESIFSFIHSLFFFLVVLSVLIFFHELGHFLAARSMGIRVLKFSLGFGPKVFGKKVGDTEYIVSALPLGGYVKMFGEEPEEAGGEGGEPSEKPGDESEAPRPLTAEDRACSFSHQAVWKRIIVVVAGPAFNMILAYLIFAGALAAGMGMTVPSLSSLMPTIDHVAENSPASRAGLMKGDHIIAVDDKKISNRGEFLLKVMENPGKKLTLTIGRGETTIVAPVVPEGFMAGFGEDSKEVGQIGTEPLPRVDKVLDGTPAKKSGLQAGDVVVSINGQRILTWIQMTEVVKKKPGVPLKFVVERDGQKIPLEITPEPKEVEIKKGEMFEIGLIGIERSSRGTEITADNIGEAAYKGLHATWAWTYLTLEGLVRLVTGQLSLDNIGGPILIGQLSGQAAERGVEGLFFLIALLSITLGIMNILPIPVLDGGHLMFFVIEGVMGKPLSIRKREIAQQVGLVMLLLLMTLAFYNDIVRLFVR